ncbi:thioesterase family protein [Xanthobacter autotrophicus]|uniref:acyl-CoA thioesterase n=1 Tax=Xanthobacter TaxID=279 RepID=UPI001E4C633C|nr:thioesterase family protein [Xanthobacter autotrophicus]UDQ89075.1 acyl-CoA thioesterase [Xanthobacter autotrophicus]UJX45193.1 acyl-CoA thioesterase [Xanthobacter sp. YC-JY1]
MSGGAGTGAGGGTAAREEPVTIDGFKHVLPITTRWMDVDVYGHVNNVVYYSYFDTVVNEQLVSAGLLDPQTSPVIGLVVETRCTYFRSLTYPAPVKAAMRVTKLGSSSVRYQIALFQGDDPSAAAQGHFVHVYVERATQRPVPIPEPVRALLQTLVV